MLTFNDESKNRFVRNFQIEYNSFSTFVGNKLKYKMMIKNIFAAVLFTVAASFTQNLKAQNVNEIKEKKELLKLYSSLLDKNVDLAKEKEVNVQLAEEVKSINKKTDRKTDDFTSSDPNSTSKMLKKRQNF